jgi:hypothetical protein
MNANMHLSREKWEEALNEFVKSRTIYDNMSKSEYKQMLVLNKTDSNSFLP